MTDQGDRTAVPTPAQDGARFPHTPSSAFSGVPLSAALRLSARLSCPLTPDGCGGLCPHPGQRCRREGSCPASEGRPALPWTLGGS